MRILWPLFFHLVACQHEGIAVYEAADGSLSVRSGNPSHGAVAWGTFEDNLNVTGWGILDVETSGSYSDQKQHLAAGMVEGYLTARHIHSAYVNALGYVFHGNVSQPSLKFLADQMAWAQAQSLANPTDLLWQHTSALLSQFDGLVMGYELIAKSGHVPHLEESAFHILNGVGDLFQIMPAVDKDRRVDFAKMSSQELREFVKTAGMCSALIKVPGDYEDLFMAHSSWFSYSDTDRIFKHYHFKFQMPAAADRISFSSYPGYLESLDDFYMMSSGLGMVQTSNNLMNQSLLELITPQSLLAWQRVRVASAIAHTGREWYETFRSHASGTYVNQYMVVDFKLFKPRTALEDGMLWVIEEIPGLVVGEDQTEILRRGYWPSYNVPFYKEVYERSGYKDKRLGPDGNYQLAPRAKIFRRDQATVTDMSSFKRLMRYANYSDPYSVVETGAVDFAAAICMRGDLADNGRGGAGGCYDTKVTSFRHGFWDLAAEVVNGPSSTSSDGSGGLSGNPPFSWRPSDSMPHRGLPQTYAFDFLTTRPSNVTCSDCDALPVVTFV